jgi:Protein of unknown function (DUF1416)
MSCAAPVGGAPLTGAIGSQSLIEGTVSRDGAGVGGAYVRLLDASGEFTAEVPTDGAGSFRFFARPGEWTLRTLVPRSPAVELGVSAEAGRVTTVTVRV